MGEDLRDTWNNERWVIDRLIDAVEAGDTGAKLKLGQRLMDGIDQDNWNGGKLIEAGQFLPLTFLDPANIEDDDRQWFCDDETIADARLDEILNSGLSGAELTRWRQRVVERAFFPEKEDRDMLWLLISVRRAGGRMAYVASFGYGLADQTFVAAYGTYAETMNALRSVGFTSLKDYRARAAEAIAQT